MKEDRTTRIEALLNAAFAPQHLLVKDQSHLHTGHVGAQEGRGHFDVRIVADAFRDCNRLQAHRLIYDALDDLMTSDIHALSIQASAPDSDKSA